MTILPLLKFFGLLDELPKCLKLAMQEKEYTFGTFLVGGGEPNRECRYMVQNVHPCREINPCSECREFRYMVVGTLLLLSNDHPHMELNPHNVGIWEW